MKTIRNKFLSLINSLIAAVLSIIGIGAASCDKIGVTMYGTPSADLSLSGTITDAQTNQQLEDIQVVVKVGEYNGNDTLYTDSEGNYNRFYNHILPSDTLTVQINDTAGNYESQTVGTKIKYGGKHDSWYQGSAEIQIDAKLTKKQ